MSREQLLAASLSSETIRRARRAGRLRPLFRGVYAVGHVALTREGWWTGALLACGDGATLSHLSAAAKWDLRRGSILPVDVITMSGGGRKRDRITTHRMRLHPDDTVIYDGLRVTTPARTIVDLAARLTGRPLRETVERAQDRRRFNPTAIRATLDRIPRCRGTRQLRDLLDMLQPDADNARSRLERLFLRLVRKARLPRPEVNHPLAGKERDFVWPSHRLAVEVDGYRYHSSRRAQRRDRRRDRELVALGWRPVRFTYEEVAFEPAVVGADLVALLGVSSD